MKTLNTLQSEDLKDVQYILTDIDGTITSNGRLLPEAYNALWELQRNGFVIIPITGGSAGTAIHLVRTWPIDGIITETGALAFWEEDGSIQELIHPQASTDLSWMALVRDDVLSNIPASRLAKDQFGRRFDLAFDHAEDWPKLGTETVKEIAARIQSHGVSARISSIHVNSYKGTYDKLSMTEMFIKTVYKLSIDSSKERFLYIGDAPNDEPMFEHFPLSFGVADVLLYKDQMEFMPAYVAKEKAGLGFAEIVEKIIVLKNATN